ncbi:hypothetical protein TcCL_NonESM08222, partial [Trypanosoma cruzi]
IATYRCANLTLRSPAAFLQNENARSPDELQLEANCTQLREREARVSAREAQQAAWEAETAAWAYSALKRSFSGVRSPCWIPKSRAAPRRWAGSIDSQNLLIEAPGDSQYELQGSNLPRVWQCFLKSSVSLTLSQQRLTSHPTSRFHQRR